jgi:hypothetical protein
MTERTEKWTPKPWHATEPNGMVKTERNQLIASVYGDHPDCEEDDRQKANAHLIAAAPALYEALDIVLDALGALSNPSELHGWVSEEQQEFVFAARRKARGES